MPALQDFLAVLQNIKESAANLGKDVDTNDKREETKADFAMLTLSFSDLQSILKNITPEDRANLEREMKELFSGQESLAEYTRDVQKILTDVKNRVSKDVAVQEKIEKSTTIEQKGQEPASILDGFTQLLKQLNDKLSKK